METLSLTHLDLSIDEIGDYVETEQAGAFNLNAVPEECLSELEWDVLIGK